jgi:two-component system sensor histidine kinase ChvG
VILSTRFDKTVQIGSGAELIETAVENLIENALDFAPPGSTVSLTMRKIGKSAEIIVADQGPGVAAELLSKVFQRYFSDRAGKPENDDPTPHFGIGLWVVRRNIEALGGMVRARNLTPSGLEITLSVPIQR